MGVKNNSKTASEKLYTVQVRGVYQVPVDFLEDCVRHSHLLIVVSSFCVDDLLFVETVHTTFHNQIFLKVSVHAHMLAYAARKQR
jgi:hypothetical protein